uniref:Asparagine synthetase domain-containing protein 1 n=1 Tax=Capra hircus TaxID=9925 RepID=A0A452E0X3_CAPHI
CQSRVKAVLTGVGAEEQLASYSHHHVHFQTHRLERLNKEIEMELGQISSRNLGRDDQVIGDHGKEARFPFLNENIVSFLNFLPVWEKANLTLSRKAMQFESRIAKIEKNNDKPSDKCGRLQVISLENLSNEN